MTLASQLLAKAHETRCKLSRTLLRQIFVFLACFISYIVYHGQRKTLSGVKTSVKHAWTGNSSSNRTAPLFSDAAEAIDFLGILDAIFMISYAISLFFFGWLGDRISPKLVLVAGMFGASIALVVFGSVPEWAGFYSIPYYVITYIVFGLTQGCGHSSEVTIMSNWFGPRNRGAVLGLWSASQPVGNILGSLLTGGVTVYGYEWAFVATSAVLFAVGVFFLLFVPEQPTPSEWQEINGHPGEEDKGATKDIAHPKALSFWKALLLPSVAAYCMCNACLKFVNYAFFFWLPLYLSESHNWSETRADTLSTWYDVGGIVGSVSVGIISDRLGYRSPLIVLLLLLSLVTLPIYANIGANLAWNIIVMFVIGVAISGPYNLIVSTISVDLGAQIGGNERAMSTVAGLVDGTGSVGSAIGQFLLPHVEVAFGWKTVFYCFIVLNFIATLCLVQRLIADIRQIIRARREGRPAFGPHIYELHSSQEGLHQAVGDEAMKADEAWMKAVRIR